MSWRFIARTAAVRSVFPTPCWYHLCQLIEAPSISCVQYTLRPVTCSLTEGQIAVIFEEARPSEIAPLIVDAYGLTRREGRIAQLVLRGHFTAEVSEELHITPNTVRDLFKAIFDKVGVRSRKELVGQVFAQHYQTRMAAGRALDPDGWFT